MQNSQRVQVAERQGNLGRVKLHLSLVKHGLPLEMIENLAAVQKVHDEIDLALGLKGKVQAADKGVPHLAQHIALHKRVRDIVGVDEKLFPQRLHGVDALGENVAHLIDAPKAALAHHLEHLKVGVRHAGLNGWLVVADAELIALCLEQHLRLLRVARAQLLFGHALAHHRSAIASHHFGHKRARLRIQHDL